MIYFIKEGLDNDILDLENEILELYILLNLIIKDCIFVVFCDDNVNDYYVMKVSLKLVVL